jgi:3-methyladenine DNA glycosylase AlkC
MSESTYEPLKNMYSPEKLAEIGKWIKASYNAFDEKEFLQHFKTTEWKNAALKARVRLIAEALHHGLPKDYGKAIEILKPASLNLQWGYFGIFFPDYVECYGLQHWDISMKALQVFTQTSSGEFAIRPFIVQNPSKAFAQLEKWSKSKNHHHRRLSSEGCRPRLPWGLQLKTLIKDPTPIFRILENLKEDKELYVRKSVANNLNDISKDHPQVVLGIAKKWRDLDENTDWIIQHAMRTLLKKGNKDALKIFGHHNADQIEVSGLKLNKSKFSIGESATFTFNLNNADKKPREIRLEYQIHFAKQASKTSAKVFQFKKTKLAKGLHPFSKKHSFRDLSTRKHYAGKHALCILVNGEEKGRCIFHLVE